MKQELKAAPRWLVWIAGIAAGLCIAAIVLLVVLIAGRGKEKPADPTEPADIAAEKEATLPEWTEPTLPVFDLPENPYTEEDFDYRGDFLECTAGPCKIGVDVSAWQNEVDWQQVKDAGMEFAIVRLAWRGSTEGGIYEDKYARANYQGAKDAGLQVGGYFFSQAVSVEEAIEEAEFVLEMVKDWEMEMPIVYDWERSTNRTADIDKQTLTDCALAFCQRIEEAGYEAMTYFNIRQIYNEVYIEELEDYGLWLAMYDAPMTFPYKVGMWQYTARGSVPGIGTNVDLNIYFEYE